MDEPHSLDVLAIAAHPDDVELSIGGTLAGLSMKGYRIGILDLTRGEKGTRGNPQLRASEAARAAGILGAEFRENLDLGDSRIMVTPETRVAMVRAVRRLRPRLVFTQHWEDPHPDHAHTSRLVREAAHLAGLIKFDEEAGLERWRPSCVAYFLFPRTVTPTFIVDITDANERKWQAIRAHASQFHNPQSSELQTRVSTPAFLREIEARDRYFGAMLGVDYGEPFLVREALNVDDPVSLLTRQMNMYS
ncbi:MAG: bacillithiol biosynthesis deacetylase BshB1 [Acidobacteriota bacterium]|nr:MAG: bacillithiol biosynthesis deacetylase BshB1 [Acidobacteriota bacterium]